MNIRHAIIDFFLLFGKRYTAKKCGHRTRRSGRYAAFGEYRSRRFPLNDSGTMDWCLECMGKMTIRCGWCGDPIFVCDPITLYVPKDPTKMPEYAVRYEENGHVHVVGCLGWGCADSGADRKGFWMPGEDGKGRVARVPSPIEIMFATGEAQVVDDVGSISEAVAASERAHEKLAAAAKK